MNIVKKRNGFTLAEVLITLSIIGVVAALTIPSLVVKNQEKEAVVQLKKAYNVLSNAFSLAVVEYGDVTSWGWDTASSPQGSKNIMDKFAPFLNIIKRCDGPIAGCYESNVDYKWFDGTSAGIYSDFDSSKIVLGDGMILATWSNGGQCDSYFGQGKLAYGCGTVAIDVNGRKGPNIWAKDVFELYITRGGIVPRGLPGDTSSMIERLCRGGNGQACSGWVLMKENLNYPAAGKGWND